MDRFENLIIRASAGTGKTYQLSNRFLALLFSGVTLDEILAVTFTRKAAGEILDRVLLRLAHAASSDQECQKLGKALDEPDLSTDHCRQLLRQVIRNLHRLRISTLDSFFAQLAGSFSLELGMPAGWTIVDQLQENEMRDEAVALILREHSTDDIARLMHLISKGDVDRPIAQLIRETVRDLHGVYLDSSREAWDQFPDVRPLSRREVDQLIGTIGNWSDASNGIIGANESAAKLAMIGDWETFFEKGIPNKLLNGETTYKRAEIPAELCAAYQRLMSHGRAYLIKQLAEQTIATRDLLERFDAMYQRHRRTYRAMRFDDVARKLAARSGAAARDHSFRLDSRLHHILLDEFQDTSITQWNVLKPFIDLATQGEDRQVHRDEAYDDTPSNSLFCVGDVKQAIYGWRGGSSEIFDVVEREVPGIRTAALSTSYRSSQPVIDFVNKVFANLTAHPNLDKYADSMKQWQNAFQKHSTARPELPGYACLITSTVTEVDGEKPTDDTMRFAAEKVAEIARKAPGRSIAVLMRKNSAIARMIYELRCLGVPASEEGGNPLTDSAAVQLVLSLLRMCDHPADKIARFHVATSPLATHIGFSDFNSDEAAWEVGQRFRRQLMVDGYGETIARLAEWLIPVSTQRDHDRLMQLIELAHRHQPRSTLRADDFIAFVEQEAVPDPAPTDVRVTTIHKSKGLQFDVVVLPEWDVVWVGESPPVVIGRPEPTAPVDRVVRYRGEDIQSLLPERLQEVFSDSSHRIITEMLCVMYVALTRAIHAMYVIIPPSTPSEKNLPRKMTGLLRAALVGPDKLEPDTVAFEVGDRNWIERLPEKSSSSHGEEAKGAKEPESEGVTITFAPSTGVTLDRTSPSQMEGGGKTKAGQVLRLDNADAQARGTLVHEWFEQIDWIEDSVPASVELRKLALSHDTHRLNLEKLLREFRSMLNQKEIARLLKRSFYDPNLNTDWMAALGDYPFDALRLEVRKEQRILTRVDGRLLSGSIDRLVLVHSGNQLLAADIIDFKTDAVTSKDFLEINSRAEFYQPQMQAYRQATAIMFRLPLNQVTARLAFVKAGRILTCGQDTRPRQRTLF